MNQCREDSLFPRCKGEMNRCLSVFLYDYANTRATIEGKSIQKQVNNLLF